MPETCSLMPPPPEWLILFENRHSVASGHSDARRLFAVRILARRFHVLELAEVFGGLAVGIALGIYGLGLTAFETGGDVTYYIPNTYLGLAISVPTGLRPRLRHHPTHLCRVLRRVLRWIACTIQANRRILQ